MSKPHPPIARADCNYKIPEYMMTIVTNGDDSISSRGSADNVDMPPAPKNGSIPSHDAVPPDTYCGSYVYTTTVNERYTGRLASRHSVGGPISDG